MRESDLLALVGTIHEVPFAEHGWATVASKLEELYSGCALSLVVPLEAGSSVADAVRTNVATEQISLEWHAPSVTPEFTELFVQHFRVAPANPYLEPRAFAPSPASVHLSSELAHPRDVTRSAMYNEWMKPQGLSSAVGLVAYLEENGRPDMPALHLFRRVGRREFIASERRTLSLLVPHIRQAIHSRWRVAALEAERTAFADVLDRLTIGVILLDSRGRMCGANQAAEAILRSGHGINYVDSRLAADKPQTTRQLQHLVREAGSTARGMGTGGGGSILLPRQNAPSLAVIVAPLRAAGAELREASPAVIVFLTNPALDPPTVEEVLRSLHDLTPREAQLARGLADGWSLNDAARHLGTTISTERKRLSAIFQKTRTDRQATLVKLVLTHAMHVRMITRGSTIT